MDSFGHLFKFSSFGESHGKAIGCIVDGVPAGLDIDIDFIQKFLDRRKPGKNEFETQRKESDSVEILSGVFEGISTGTPISMIIYNNNAKSKDYSNIKDIFRPGHADFTYWNKYGIRDYRGGGRSSARETAVRVSAGAIAKLILNRYNIKVDAGISQIHNLKSDKDISKFDFEYAKSSQISALDKDLEESWKNIIKEAKNNHDSVGGVVTIKVSNMPIGLGEPLYYKLDAVLANALMSINATKAVEFGNGTNCVNIFGSENNDEIAKNGFLSNNSGGILGGISNGEDLIIKVYFKPTPSIFKTQKTINIYNEEIDFKLQGRHDPCVAPRGSVVCEAMVSVVLVDMLLLNLTSKISNLDKIYK